MEVRRPIERLMQEREAGVTDEAPDGFEVRRIAVEELDDVDTFVVGLAEHEDGSGEALLLMASLTVADEQDRALGQDTYCVSTAWGATVYGGMTECALRGDLLLLRFDAVAAETLGIGQDCRFRLRVDPGSVERLKDGLRAVLSTGHPPVQVQL